MGFQEDLKANGVGTRTPLVKVFSDIIGTTRYDKVIKTFLEDDGVGLKDLKIDVTLKEVDRLFLFYRC